MNNLKFQVISKNNEIDFFDNGFIAPYYYIMESNKEGKQDEFIVKIFFDKEYIFKGIVLSEEYNYYLKDKFESILSSDISTDIEEYESVREVVDGIISQDIVELCRCIKCKKISNWDDCDVWKCENCNEYICNDCLHEYDLELSRVGIAELDDILCHECYNEVKVDLLKEKIAELSEILEDVDLTFKFGKSEIERMIKNKNIKEEVLQLLKKNTN